MGYPIEIKIYFTLTSRLIFLLPAYDSFWSTKNIERQNDNRPILNQQDPVDNNI